MNIPPKEQQIPVLQACSTNPSKPRLETTPRENTGRKVFSSIDSLLRRFQRSRTQAGYPPIREELFGIERLEQHAACLAGTQRIALSPVIDRRLEARLRDNDKALRLAYLTTIKASRDTRSTTPAAEWLVDNFHVLAEQVLAIRTDFPP